MSVITDSHSHLYWDTFGPDRAQVMQRARAAGVTRQIVVGTDLATSRAAMNLCANQAHMIPTAGLHPHDAESLDASLAAELEELCARPECVGVGETGLDFFRQRASPAAQRKAFRWQLELACKLSKPVVVHCRDAHEQTVEALREVPKVRGVMHCYSLGPDELAPYLELGFYISFSGMVTYPNNDANRAAARAVPQDRLLVETDCPFLPPQSKRGQRNEPAFAREVLEQLARERGADLEALARVTSRNAAHLFGLPIAPGT